jgi:hypothetical protein
MKFGTVINCMDGRVQFPVLEYLKKNYDVEFFDAANESGPLRILTDRAEKCRLISLKDQIAISLQEHGSRFIAIVGHHDCTSNPLGREEQEKQMDEALRYLSAAFGEEIFYVALWVNEKWEVEEYKRIG